MPSLSSLRGQVRARSPTSSSSGSLKKHSPLASAGGSGRGKHLTPSDLISIAAVYTYTNAIINNSLGAACRVSLEAGVSNGGDGDAAAMQQAVAEHVPPMNPFYESFLPLEALMMLQRVGRGHVGRRGAIRGACGPSRTALKAPPAADESSKKKQAISDQALSHKPTPAKAEMGSQTPPTRRLQPLKAAPATPSPVKEEEERAEVSSSSKPRTRWVPTHSPPRLKRAPDSFSDSPYRVPVVGGGLIQRPRRRDRGNSKGGAAAGKEHSSSSASATAGGVGGRSTSTAANSSHFSLHTVRDLKARKARDKEAEGAREAVGKAEEEERSYILTLQRSTFETIIYKCVRSKLAIRAAAAGLVSGPATQQVRAGKPVR